MRDKIEIIDTTLRDGEQTDGVSFNAFEKKHIARFLIEQLGVNRIEVTSARVSAGEHQVVKEIFERAASKEYLSRIEVLGFVDHKASVDWILEAGGRVINLLTKGSRLHCEEQLKKTISEHLADIEKSVAYATENGLSINVYLEDWSSGFLNSPDYVQEFTAALLDMPISRLMLPDTLGIMSPEEVKAGIAFTLNRFPNAHLDFHGHNDYGLAVANTLAAVEAGVQGIHATINGMGERAGNTPLESAVAAIHDKLKVKTTINEKSIADASNLVSTFSGKRVGTNQPIVGQDVYTQTSGIHADGDKKSQLYVNPILPERFGRERVYALGKLSGKASITNNLNILGIELQPERVELLLKRVKELGDQKKRVSPDDLPYLIEDMFGSIQGEQIKITAASVHTHLNERPQAEVEIEFQNKTYHATAVGDGGYNACMNAIEKIAAEMGMVLPALIDYEVHIPPGGETDALVETSIAWRKDSSSPRFTTRGFDCDQLVAAIKATEKMLNRILMSEEQ